MGAIGWEFLRSSRAGGGGSPEPLTLGLARGSRGVCPPLSMAGSGSPDPPRIKYHGEGVMSQAPPRVDIVGRWSQGLPRTLGKGTSPVPPRMSYYGEGVL